MFEPQVSRMSEVLGGIDKYNDKYLDSLGMANSVTHRLGCNLYEEEFTHDNNFSNLELSQISDDKSSIKKKDA